jgi:RNA recognition motif-containing protein
VFRITALAQEETQITEQSVPEEEETNKERQPKNEEELPPRRTKLYVGNLPRSCDIAQLTQLFQEFGTVESVEVVRNEETGISRGFAFVTMSTVKEAKSAIEKLQGSDLGGRDMIVNFPAKVLSKKKETDDSYIETPYQLFVGNLAWSVKKEILKSLFSQHGNVSAAKVIYSGKGGVPRAFGFVCLSSQSEMEDAIASLHGKEFHGRNLMVRQARQTSKDMVVSDVEENIAKPSTMVEDSMTETVKATFVGSAYGVYVSNLSLSVKNKALSELFSQHGNVLDARVLYARKAGRSRAYGFVNFSSQAEVEAAIAALDKKEFYERKLVVKEAKVKSQL